MKPSEKIIQEICDFLSGDLNSTPCEDIREQIEKCHNCEVYLDKMRRTVELYKKVYCNKKVPVKVIKTLFKQLHLPKPNQGSTQEKA